MSPHKKIILFPALVALTLVLTIPHRTWARIFLDSTDEKDCICDRSVPNVGVWQIGFTSRKNPLIQMTDINDAQKDTIRLEVMECGKVVMGTFSSYGGGGEKMRAERTEDPILGVVYKGMTPRGGVQLRFWGQPYIAKDGKRKWDLMNRLWGDMQGMGGTRPFIAEFSKKESSGLRIREEDVCACREVALNVKQWDKMLQTYRDKELLDYAIKNHIPALDYEEGWVHDKKSWPGSERWKQPYSYKLEGIPPGGSPTEKTVSNKGGQTYQEMVETKALGKKPAPAGTKGADIKVGGSVTQASCGMNVDIKQYHAQGSPQILVDAVVNHEAFHQKLCRAIKSGKNLDGSRLKDPEGFTMDQGRWDNHPANHAYNESHAYEISLKTVCPWLRKNCNKDKQALRICSKY